MTKTRLMRCKGVNLGCLAFGLYLPTCHTGRAMTVEDIRRRANQRLNVCERNLQ